MKIALIVAMATNRVIGINGQMPWHLSADLKHFRQLTGGHCVLMGRKTHESIGRALPQRRNLVISRNPHYRAAGCEVFSNTDSALAACAQETEIFIIGGAAFYQEMLQKAEFIYLTKINKDFLGDTYFPELNSAQWQEIERIDISDDTSVDFDYSFLKLQRRKGAE
jgi:dihydrofolate reductase